METAEEFAVRLVTHLADTLIASRMSPREAKAHAIALIEADRAAVALAAKREVLEEIRDYTASAYPNSGDWQRRYEALLSFLDAKYTRHGGVR
ncbi:MAG TPA: hypothetical protein VER11_34370 [Polyangiaceae bacterium]|nr:hypothetical protein [Polyangiaceae bacterium]